MNGLRHFIIQNREILLLKTPPYPLGGFTAKKALFKRGVRCSEALRHLLAEGRILTKFLN